jgi:hypothetical protein
VAHAPDLGRALAIRRAAGAAPFLKVRRTVLLLFDCLGGTGRRRRIEYTGWSAGVNEELPLLTHVDESIKLII